MADLNTYSAPHENLTGDAFLPDPPADRPRPNFGPAPVSVPPPKGQLANNHSGEGYGVQKPGTSLRKMTFQMSLLGQLVLIVVLFALVIILVAIFD
nr:Uncharacterised protein [Streptococcus thermophilus]